MRLKTCGLAVALAVALTGTAYAQQPAGGGSATGNMNNPGSVKSNSEKMNERTTGSATGSTMGTAGAATVPGTGTSHPGVGMGTSTTAPAR
ncbi:hypothetical protein QO001_006560 [Methylobacterium brachiatum]|jgi:hypothetical protein|uniref:Uncharacterized protein n=3 Tax=Methylobacterium TaxID=407 RepID=A0A509EGV2_9HYPH|nr:MULTISPECIES: hypothetical protein [Methylobacterium]AYO86509.1 hypothetical protein EBB05_29545 [Methylobacterium brachiatum]MBP29125.1 hypothetical protein [Methylobacterium sp.]MCB4806548.1 hypothetical protein [Methylobacterium brachiatum]MDQ0547601.1 hypothetical protein [Methylobacterium brachiatum]VUD73391.1 hypothetical protein MET9862_04006 [Methylobacterium symbioticum]